MSLIQDNETWFRDYHGLSASAYGRFKWWRRFKMWRCYHFHQPDWHWKPFGMPGYNRLWECPKCDCHGGD